MPGTFVLHLTAIAVCMPEPCIFISLYLLLCFKANGLMGERTAMGSISLQMAAFTRVHGEMVRNMEKGNLFMLTWDNLLGIA